MMFEILYETYLIVEGNTKSTDEAHVFKRQETDLYICWVTKQDQATEHKNTSDFRYSYFFISFHRTSKVVVIPRGLM